MYVRKTGYRTGLSPKRRRTECQNAIRDALRQGKKTFGELLLEKHMSRSTLAFHLKEMHQKGQLERQKDHNDYRITYYTLTKLGRGELRRQEDINTLSSAKFLFPSPEIVEGVTKALFELLKPSIREYILALSDEDSKLLKDAITYSIYSENPLKNKVRDYVNELAKLAASSMLSQLAVPTQRHVIKKMPNISLVFKLDSHKIENYLKHVEDETGGERLPRLPNIHDFKKRKQERQRPR